MSNDQIKLNSSPKFILNYQKRPVIDPKIIHAFLEKCNQKEYGEEILAEHILAYFVETHSETDIDAICSRYLSPWEKVKRKYILEKKDKGLEISFEEFVARKMKV
jgi:hypothetical protein